MIDKNILANIRGMMATAEIKVAAARATMRAEGQRAIAPIFKTFMDLYPEIKALRIECYTPYFNDGEECFYRIRAFSLEVKPEFYETWVKNPYEKPEENEYWCEGDEYFLNTELPRPTQLKNDLKTFQSSLKNEELFSAVFGDHVRVTITHDGLITIPYTDHD